VPTDFDEWLEEPNEPNPEDRWGDPENDLVSVPSVETSGDEDAAGIDVDGDLAKFFWVTVIYANVALAGVSLGLLLIAFRSRWAWGGGAVVVGLFALYRTYDLYRTYQEHVADSDEVTPDADADGAVDTDSDGATDGDSAGAANADADTAGVGPDEHQ